MVKSGQQSGTSTERRQAEDEEADAPAVRRSGRVALIGRPNVGKSTLLNAALEQPLAIVSPMPQTTRDAILGVVHRGEAELALLDTPGLHKPRTELGRLMNSAAREAARSADVIVFVAEVPLPKKERGRGAPAARERRGAPAAVEGAPAKAAPRKASGIVVRPHPGDVTLLADLPPDVPVILALNKIDRIREKALMLPLLEALGRVRSFAAIVPISARKLSGVTRMLDEVAKLCPEGAWRFGEDDVTDRPTRFFAAEYVREQILRATQEEVPHSAAVVIDRYLEPPAGGVVHIDATIHIERSGQKKILIGKNAEMLKRIGIEARRRIEELVGRQINLKLWVRVTPDWRQSVPTLEELGYSKAQPTADRAGGAS